MSNPLPVIDLLNNVRIVSNYLYATQQIVLTSYIIDNNPQLATNFVNWQQDIFDEYFEGLLDENLLAQPETIQQFYNDKILPSTIQELAQSALIPQGSVTPRLITAADAVSNLIMSGNSYIDQLTAIAVGIENADKAKVAALMVQVKQLSDEFDEEEQKIVSGSFKLGLDVVVTAVNIAIAVGSEGEDIQPVVKSVSQVATDIVNEIDLKDSAKQTITQLQQSWSELDADTSALAHITLIVNQLNAVTQDTSATLTALDRLVSDWQEVADATQVSADEWAASGSAAFEEWCSRMVIVSFATVTQNVSQPSMETGY
jgi:hypothetical protein